MPPSARFELDQRLEHALCDLVANGVPLVDAARALGLGPRTVYRWMAVGRGQEPESPHAQRRYQRFVDSVEAARAERAYQVEQLVTDARGRTMRLTA